MASLRAIAPALNQATQDATRIIAEVEAFLNNLHLGVAGIGDCFREKSYRVDEDEARGEDPRRRERVYLAYGRINSGSYCIHLFTETEALQVDPYTGNAAFEAIDGDQDTWQGASRDDRLKSFASLPSLLKAIATNAANRIGEVDQATAQIGETLKMLGLASEPTAPVVAIPRKARRSAKS